MGWERLGEKQVWEGNKTKCCALDESFKEVASVLVAGAGLCAKGTGEYL